MTAGLFRYPSPSLPREVSPESSLRSEASIGAGVSAAKEGERKNLRKRGLNESIAHQDSIASPETQGTLLNFSVTALIALTTAVLGRGISRAFSGTSLWGNVNCINNPTRLVSAQFTSPLTCSCTHEICLNI